MSGKEIPESPIGYVQARYIWPNRGRHDIGFGLGRHVGGGVEIIEVPEDVARLNPAKFEIVSEQQVIADPPPQTAAAPEPLATPAPPPQFQSPDGGFSWTTDEGENSEDVDLSGFNSFIQKQLKDAGLTTKEKMKEAGLDGLQALKGIGPATAKKIMELAE